MKFTPLYTVPTATRAWEDHDERGGAGVSTSSSRKLLRAIAPSQLKGMVVYFVYLLFMVSVYDDPL